MPVLIACATILQVLDAKLSVPLDAVRVLVQKDCMALGEPLEFLPFWALLACLEMWEASRWLLSSAVHAMERRLNKLLPHEHVDSPESIVRATVSLMAARSVIIDEEALDPCELLDSHIEDVVRLAYYAIGCSTGDFALILQVLQSSRVDAIDLKMAAVSTSTETAYLWCRFHLCALTHLQASRPPRVEAPPGPQTPLRVEPIPVQTGRSRLLLQWLHSLRLSSREAAGRLDKAVFPLDPMVLSTTAETDALVQAVWDLVSDPNVREVHKRTEDARTLSKQLGVWPLDHEQPRQPMRRAQAMTDGALGLGEPQELFQRKGDFVRAMCVNALNPCQLAVALGRGVHQLELSTPPADDFAHRPAGESDTTQSVALAVQQSCASESFAARCLCAHTKLPLYLAGGDSVVQCWQFGQAFQGQGLHDHLRAQYKLPAGGRVANIRISPLCSEQFGSACRATTELPGLHG